MNLRDQTRAVPGDGAGVGEVTEQWSQLTARTMQLWAQEMMPLVGSVGESAAVAGQRAADLFDVSLRAARAARPGQPEEPDGTAVWKMASGYVEQLTGMLMTAASEPTTGVDQLMKLWRLSLDEWQGEWEGGPPAGQDERNVLTRLHDLYWDAWERTLGRLLESPDLGHTRELSQRQAKAVKAWVEFRRVSFEYQVLVADAFGRASAEFLSTMVDRTEQGLPAPSMQELLGLWGKTVDKVMGEVFAQEPYASTQGRLLNAAMAYRQAERGVVELFLEAAHVPTRTEVDEANRTIHELRRELRQLKKTVAGMQAAQKAPATAPKPPATAPTTPKAQKEPAAPTAPTPPATAPTAPRAAKAAKAAKGEGRP